MVLKRRAWRLIGLLAGPVLFYLLLLPPLATFLPMEYEQYLAIYLGPIPEVKVCAAGANPRALELFQKIVSRVYPVMEGDAAIPLTFKPVQAPADRIFASLGGHLYIPDEAIQKAASAEELAADLAQAIEHVRRRDVIRQVSWKLVALAKGAPMDTGLADTFMRSWYGGHKHDVAGNAAVRRLTQARIVGVNPLEPVLNAANWAIVKTICR